MISLIALNICACSEPATKKDNQNIILRHNEVSSGDSLVAEIQKKDRSDTVKAAIIRAVDSFPKPKRKVDRNKREQRAIHKHRAPGQIAIDSLKRAKEEKKFNKE